MLLGVTILDSLSLLVEGCWQRVQGTISSEQTQFPKVRCSDIYSTFNLWLTSHPDRTFDNFPDGITRTSYVSL